MREETDQNSPADMPIASWIPLFAVYNISEDLLHEAFPHTDIHSFKTLYANTKKLGNVSPSWKNTLKDVWQLQILAGVTPEIFPPETNNYVDAKGNTYAHYLCLLGNPELFQRFLRTFPDLNPKDLKTPDGRTLLHFAGYSGSLPMVQWLLKTHSNLKDSKNKYGSNILHSAAWSGSLAMVQWLLEKHPDLKDLKNNQGDNVLHTAALSGSLAKVQWLLETYPNLKDLKNNKGVNVLHCAALSGSLAIVQWLLETYPNLKDSKNNYGNNVLYYAAKSGSLELVQWLSQTYPDLKDSKNNDGANVLHHAAGSGSLAIVQWLLETYPNLKDSKDNRGANALHYAAESGSLELVRWLLKTYPNLKDSKDNYGINVLHFAARLGSLAMVQWLLETYPNLKDSKNNYGNNVLYYAAKSGSLELVQWLLEKYPDLKDLKNNRGDNVLHTAALSGSLAKVQWLLETYPNLKDSKNNEGANVLHFAARLGSLAKVQWLLEKYPDLKNLRDNIGNNILDYAEASKSAPLLDYLLEEEIALVKLLWKKNIEMPNLLTRAKEKLLSATVAWINNTATENQITLINTFTHEWVELFTHKMFIEKSHEILEKIDHSPELSETCQKKIPTIKLALLDLENKTLSINLLLKLYHAALEVPLPQTSTLFFPTISKSTFIEQLGILTEKLLASEPETTTLSTDAVITLSVILDDQQRSLPNPPTKELDNLVASKLLSTQNLKILRPTPALTTGLDITPENYQVHFEAIFRTAESAALSTAVRKTITETILPGLNHLIRHEDKIVKHTMEKFGVLYFLDDNEKLPLHTDHAPQQNETECRNTLHRLIENLFGAYYATLRAGKVNEFFNQLTYGYCLEGRTRDTLAWAAKFSEIKPFEEFMEERIKEYTAYMKIMQNKTEETLGNLDEASDFILTRFRNFPCKPHETYAPKGEITQTAINQYLQKILCYETSKTGCVIV